MKILYLGDSPAVATGFGNVSRNLLDNLWYDHEDVEITVLGINDRGGWKNPNKFDKRYKVYPSIFDNYKDELGFTRLLNVLQNKDPEIRSQDWDVLILHIDSFLLASKTIDGIAYINYLNKEFALRPKMKTILYTPIDNPLIPPEWVETMQQFDVVATYSKYGKEMISAADKGLGNRVKVIYPGIDVSNFHPIKDFKRVVKIGESEFDLKDRFVIGYVGRNQWRKDYFHLVKIFSEFKKKYPEAYLYMHTNPSDTQHDGGDIFELCNSFGLNLGEDYFVPVNHEDNQGIKRNSMNEVYNMMDVFLSCSMGEGFGLPYVEAMAAGVPVVLPDNTTSPELTGDGKWGYMYFQNNSVCFGTWDLMRERPLPDIDDAIEVLEACKSNMGSWNKKVTAAARDFVLKEVNAEKFADEFWEVIK